MCGLREAPARDFARRVDRRRINLATVGFEVIKQDRVPWGGLHQDANRTSFCDVASANCRRRRRRGFFPSSRSPHAARAIRPQRENRPALVQGRSSHTFTHTLAVHSLTRSRFFMASFGSTLHRYSDNMRNYITNHE